MLEPLAVCGCEEGDAVHGGKEARLERPLRRMIDGVDEFAVVEVFLMTTLPQKKVRWKMLASLTRLLRRAWMKRGEVRMRLLIWTEVVMVSWKELDTFVAEWRMSGRRRHRMMLSRSSYVPMTASRAAEGGVGAASGFGQSVHSVTWWTVTAGQRGF